MYINRQEDKKKEIRHSHIHNEIQLDRHKAITKKYVCAFFLLNNRREGKSKGRKVFTFTS